MHTNTQLQRQTKQSVCAIVNELFTTPRFRFDFVVSLLSLRVEVTYDMDAGEISFKMVIGCSH